MDDDCVSNPDIMVVDDSLFILKMIQTILGSLYNLKFAMSASEAFKTLETISPDLILLDLEMPETTGLEFLETLKNTPAWKDIPVIFLTSADDREKEEQALNLGAVDYVLKPISAGVLKKRIHMHLELCSYQHNLENLVDKKTELLEKTQDLILDILANVTTHRDNDTGAHIIRTTNYVKLLTDKVFEIQHTGYHIEASYARDIVKSARLHDIGKIGISDKILRKTSKLTNLEFNTIKMHTIFGAEMLDDSIKKLGSDNASFLIVAKEIILHHHEWWNGTGYPQKLSGTNIPLSARIMAIADVYDALISKRSYKNCLSHDVAVEIMKHEAGTHFDPVLMEIAEPLFPQFKEIASVIKDT